MMDYNETGPDRLLPIYAAYAVLTRIVIEIYVLTDLHDVRKCIYMKPKRKNLKTSGTLNPHPQRVSDPLFKESTFFDPEDLVQVKYEMVRRVTCERESLSEAARLFGFSRPSLYKARSALQSQGLAGLMRRRPGPRAGHKLTEEALSFIRAELERNRSLSLVALAKLLQERFGTEVHPRSIERALARKKKERRSDGR